MNPNQINLFEALGIFLEAMREQFHSIALKRFGLEWEIDYAKSFTSAEAKKYWNQRIEAGEKPQNLIDYGNLRYFAEHYRDASFFKN